MTKSYKKKTALVVNMKYRNWKEWIHSQVNSWYTLTHYIRSWVMSPTISDKWGYAMDILYMNILSPPYGADKIRTRLSGSYAPENRMYRLHALVSTRQADHTLAFTWCDHRLNGNMIINRCGKLCSSEVRGNTTLSITHYRAPSVITHEFISYYNCMHMGIGNILQLSWCKIV